MAIKADTANLILKSLVGLNGQKDKSNCFMGLFNGDPVGGGSEPTATEYKRATIGKLDEPSTQIMGEPSNGSVSNSSIIYFPEATTVGGWGTISHFGLFDAETGGNLMVYGALTAPVEVLANRVPMFRAEQFKLTLQ